MIDLDDLTLLRRGDPGGMTARSGELPEAVAQAWRHAREFRFPADFKSVDSVLITGMLTHEHPRITMRERVIQGILEKRGCIYTRSIPHLWPRPTISDKS